VTQPQPNGASSPISREPLDVEPRVRNGRAKPVAAPSPDAFTGPELERLRDSLRGHNVAEARGALAPLAVAVAAHADSPEQRTRRASDHLDKALATLGSSPTPAKLLEALPALEKSIAAAERAICPPPTEEVVLGAKPLDVDAIFAPLPPVAYLSPDLQWCPGRPATVVGYGGSGKTMAIQSAAVSLASGERAIWGQFRTGRRARVLHLDQDNGTRATVRRYQRLAFGLNVSMEQLRGYLRVVPYPTIRLTDPTAADAYKRAVEGWDLCILDAVRGFMPGIDENDSRIRDYLDPLAAISEATGCTFLLIHHEGKGGSDRPDHEAGRGSSAFYDASGAQIRLMREQHDGAELRRVKMGKASSEGTGVDLEPFYLDFEDVADDDGLDLKRGVRVTYKTEEQKKGGPAGQGTRLAEAKKRALDYIRSETARQRAVPGAENLAEALEMRRATVSAAVNALEMEKLIETTMEKSGRGGKKPRIWALAAPGFNPPPRRPDPE
jgi:hypothetical protein